MEWGGPCPQELAQVPAEAISLLCVQTVQAVSACWLPQGPGRQWVPGVESGLEVEEVGPGLEGEGKSKQGWGQTQRLLGSLREGEP